MMFGKLAFRLASLILLAFTGVATAQTNGVWLPIGPFGGDARSLVADPQQPDRMVLGTRTGQVYLSMDGGRSWNRLTGLDAPSFWVVDDLLIDPGNSDVLYAGMWSLRDWGGGVFRSDDGGQSWGLLEGISGRGGGAL